MEDFAPGFKEGLEALDSALDAAFAELESSSHLVLDLRFNGGGLDAYSLRLASRFTAERRLAWTKRAKECQGWTREVQAWIEPSERPLWTKPSYVLTSGLTASAAETCALALSGLPSVTLVGERSRGIFSDMLYRKLPNGWYATLSNEAYYDAAGRPLETVGIIPEMLAPLDPGMAVKGIDPGLEAIAMEERKRCATK